VNRPSGKDTTVCTPVIINIEFTLKTSLRNKLINVTTKTTKCTLYDTVYDKKLTKLLWELHSDSLDQLNTTPSVFSSGLKRSEPLTKHKVSKNADLVTCELNTDIIECNWILTRDASLVRHMLSTCVCPSVLHKPMYIVCKPIVYY